jgi:CheY-like chemotaxis protein
VRLQRGRGRGAGPRDADDDVEIVVEDEGAGIPEDALPHIFERFRQGDASTTRQHGGLGLGLAIVRHLVELHGGTVKARNREDRSGAVFTVRLPSMGARPDSPAISSLSPRPADWRETAPSLAGVKVLVVDDEPDARDIVVAALESCGAIAFVAGSAAEGLRVLGEQRPDVLLSDIAMPGEDGCALMRAVRQLPADEGGLTPAAALTAYASEADRRNVLANGFHAHIKKPAHPLDLVTVVARLALKDAAGTD